MTPRHLLAFLGCVFLAGCAGGSNKGGGLDHDSLQGTWRAERVEIGGKVSDDESMRNLTLTFNGDKVVTEVAGVQHQGIFTLDAFRMPRQLDLKPGAGNTTDKPLFAVYAFESGNNLRICFSQKDRPNGFFANAHSDAILFELKRTPPRESLVKMSASNLVSGCRNNRSVAAAKYKDEVIEVNGKVLNTKDGHVLLAAGHAVGSQPDYVECAFNQNYKSELFRAMKIKSDQTVTLRGTFSGTFDARSRAAFVQLLNCEVVDSAAAEEKP